MDGRTAAETDHGFTDCGKEGSTTETLDQQANIKEAEIIQIIKLEDTASWSKPTVHEGDAADTDLVAGPKQKNEKQTSKPNYKRVELCMADKLRVIAAGSSGMSQRQVAKQFGISKTQVQTLLKRKDEIMRRYDEGYDSWRKRTKFTRNNFEHVNELVCKWYVEKTADNSEIVITGPMLKSKAIEISHTLGLGDEFKASNGWLECLKRRYNIQIGRKNRREVQEEGVEALTMVAMKPSQEQPETNFQRINNDGVSMAEVSRRDSRTEQQPTETDPKISNVYSMQGQRPTVHQVLIPTTQIPVYRQYPVPIMTQQPAAIQSTGTASKVPQQSVEKSAKEMAFRHKVETFNEALTYASALKSFAVERGSVTLIGLMTAMEHELEREKRNSSESNLAAQCDVRTTATNVVTATK
eukprot:gene9378-17083_t